MNQESIKPLRHLSPYRMSHGNDFDIVRLIKGLEANQFEDCSDHETWSIGFSPWETEGQIRWVQPCSVGIVAKVKVQNKKAPNSLVNEHLELQRKNRESETLSPHEIRSLKEKIRGELDKKALPATRTFQVVINEHEGILWFDTINALIQSEISNLLSECIPGLSLRPSLIPGQQTQRNIIKDDIQLPPGFNILNDSKIFIESLGVRVGSIKELKNSISGKQFDVLYLSIKSGGVCFRWHPDGLLSQIIYDSNKKNKSGEKEIYLKRIVDQIDNWLSELKWRKN